MNFEDLWNSQADHQNQWGNLGEDEKLEFVAAHEREECAKVVDHILKEGGGTYGDAIRARSTANRLPDYLHDDLCAAVKNLELIILEKNT